MKTPSPRGAWLCAALWIGISQGAVAYGAAGQEVVLDGQSAGQTFEGLGALSAGASSRLLADYPEPQRSQVLDFLFKPNFGAAFHHLKVEIGGDINSTDGIEPSHARTRQEFESPRPEYFNRGYEWWLMAEAKNRNPQVLLDILQWGAPEWIGQQDLKGEDRTFDPNTLSWEQVKKRNHKKFYTQDNADFIASFIKAAKMYHNLDIDYAGIWNEMPYDCQWIKRFRKTLDRQGLRHVQIVAADQCGRRPWEFAKDVLKDKELADAIQVIGAHYPGMLRKDEKGDDQYDSTPQARQTGKRLWSSEDGPWRGDWSGACTLAKIYNRNYIRGRMTKTIIWSLVTSYYENLPLPNSGPMKAHTPWSAHFEVQPAVWATAHTTQFTRPGWKYLDGACGLLKGEGSTVTLRSPDSGDYSVIIETVDARAPQTLVCRVTGGLSTGPLYVWRSNRQSQFDRLHDLAVRDGTFTLALDPGCIYTLTTTTGQRKGAAEPPPDTAFPLPYKDDFEASPVGALPRYFSDQGGVFEVAQRPDGPGHCLRQVIDKKGIEWAAHPTPEPFTILGSLQWRNYEVRCDVWVETSGCAAVYGRLGSCPQSAAPPQAYVFKVSTDGRWEIKAVARTIASGAAAFAAGRWHSIALRFAGPDITAIVDGTVVGTIRDWTYGTGMVGLGTGWNTARFDNVSIEPLEASQWRNLAEGRPATASSLWDPTYDAKCAVDGNAHTRWNSADGKTAGEWLEVDLGRKTRFNKVVLRQFETRIRQYKIQYAEGDTWRDAFAGQVDGRSAWGAEFPPVKSNRVRFYVVSTNGQTPSIHEFEVYDDGSKDR